jgi:glycosyltransferase involved in cell wall biosynthesis
MAKTVNSSNGPTNGFFFIVVTPSFNQAQYISQTIDSIISQSHSKHHFVIDGKSTDKTVQVLKKYQKNISWVSEPDDGQTDAINKGVAQTRQLIKKLKLNPHKVIFSYLNSDDYYLPGTFKAVAEEFNSHADKSWLVGDAVIIDAQNQQIQKPIRSYKKFFRNLLAFNKNILAIMNPIPQPAVFYKFSAVEEVGLFNKKLYYVMDYEYWLRLWQAFSSPIFCHQALATFRIHDQAKGEQGFDVQFQEQLVITKKFFKNPLALLLQQLHNLLITSIYSVIK